jgi:hypothetical protein
MTSSFRSKCSLSSCCCSPGTDLPRQVVVVLLFNTSVMEPNQLLELLRLFFFFFFFFFAGRHHVRLTHSVREPTSNRIRASSSMNSCCCWSGCRTFLGPSFTDSSRCSIYPSWTIVRQRSDELDAMRFVSC